MVNLHHVWFQNTVEEKILSRYRVSIKNLQAQVSLSVVRFYIVFISSSLLQGVDSGITTVKLLNKKNRFPCSVLTQSLSTSCDI